MKLAGPLRESLEVIWSVSSGGNELNTSLRCVQLISRRWGRGERGLCGEPAVQVNFEAAIACGSGLRGKGSGQNLYTSYSGERGRDDENSPA